MTTTTTRPSEASKTAAPGTPTPSSPPPAITAAPSSACTRARGWKPLCTTCAFPAGHVYTTYSSASNIRLSVCTRCSAFVDPLIESPPLVLALDMVLLKPRVFLHLLFNRGSPPRVAGESGESGGAGTEGVVAGVLVGGGAGADSTTKDNSSRVGGMEGERREGRGPAKAVDGQKTRAEGGGATLASPRTDQRAVSQQPSRPPMSRTARVHGTLARLALATLAAEVGVRLVSSSAASVSGSGASILLTALRAGCELGAQLGASTLVALVILRLRGWYPATRTTTTAPRDGRQEAFMPALVPLVLLYTALIPLLLQLALGIWYVPPAHPHGGEHLPSPSPPDTSVYYIPQLAAALSPVVPAPVADGVRALYTSVQEAWAADPVWAGTRLLGGMSAGFGLRVLLPTRPAETTAVVLCGWGAAGVAGRAVDALLEYL